jgi:hypothetical protein
MKIMTPSIYKQFGRPCGQLKLATWQAIDWNKSHLQPGTELGNNIKGGENIT